MGQTKKALTIYYNGFLSSGSHVYIHWGENNWQNISPDQPMVKRAGGFWQTTITVPNDASQINFVFNNGAGSWDNNNGQNWNVSISGACASGIATANPCMPVHAQAAQIFYDGSLASIASSITMHLGFNDWNDVTDTVMTRTSNGTWTGFVLVPASATQLNMAFFNQNGTWDNNNGQNYNLSVS